MKVSKVLGFSLSSVWAARVCWWGQLGALLHPARATLGTTDPSGSTSHHIRGLSMAIRTFCQLCVEILGRKQRTGSLHRFIFSQKYLALSRCVWIPANCFLRVSSAKWCISTLIVPKGDISAQGRQRRWAGKFPWSRSENSEPGDDFCSSKRVIFPPFKHTSPGADTALALAVKISSVN